MGIQAPAEVKYGLILEAVRQEYQCSVSDRRRIPIRILRLAGCRAVEAKP